MTDDRFQKYFNHYESLSTLAGKYGVTRQTLRVWLKPISDKVKLYHTKTIKPKDLKAIIEFLGEYPIRELDDL